MIHVLALVFLVGGSLLALWPILAPLVEFVHWFFSKGPEGRRAQVRARSEQVRELLRKLEELNQEEDRK